MVSTVWQDRPEANRLSSSPPLIKFNSSWEYWAQTCNFSKYSLWKYFELLEHAIKMPGEEAPRRPPHLPSIVGKSTWGCERKGQVPGTGIGTKKWKILFILGGGSLSVDPAPFLNHKPTPYKDMCKSFREIPVEIWCSEVKAIYLGLQFVNRAP